jgi:hypothetical protein
MRVPVFLLNMLLVFSFVIVSANCKGSQVKQHDGPHIVFENTEFDLGIIPQNGEFDFSFEFSNDGTDSLEILSTKVSCGCTIIEEGARILQPGESSMIKGTFYSRQYKGLLVRTIAVNTNDPENERTVLYIKAIIEQQ